MKFTRIKPKIKKSKYNPIERHVNRLIRERDLTDDGFFICCSCNKMKEKKQCQAGHFIPVNDSKFLRYYPKNIHAECIACNCFNRNGHLIGYNDFMVRKYGNEFVENLKRLSRWNNNLIKFVEKDFVNMSLEEIEVVYNEKFRSVVSEIS